MDIVRIADADDPRIAEYRDIRERDLRGRGGLFIAEGEVVLRVLLGASRHEALSVLVAEKRLKAIEPLLAGSAEAVAVYVAGQEILERIAGFAVHRGILALGRRAPEPLLDELLAGPGPACVVALFGIANHDNMGGIFRNAAAFGADAVLLDGACCDPLYRKAIRVSVGASLTVCSTRLPHGTDIVGLLAAHGFEAIALGPNGTLPLAELPRPHRAALLLGAEGHGLPDEVLTRALGVRIPMARGWDSLNVATASGIALHHLASGTGRAGG